MARPPLTESVGHRGSLVAGRWWRADSGAARTDDPRGTREGQDARTRLNIVDETDRYTSAVAGVTVEAVRAGRGTGPNVVLAVPGEGATVTSSYVGFPMRSHAHVADDRVLAAYIHASTENSQWCGIHLRSEMVYSPDAEHFAVNEPGLHFSFVTTRVDELTAAASRFGLPLRLPSRGALTEVCAGAHTHTLGTSLSRFSDAAMRDGPAEARTDDLLRAFVAVVGRDQPAGRRDRLRGLDSREVVRLCLDYVDASGRVPALGELCDAANVSERRLRRAFTEEFDMPPSTIFRSWGLDLAHRRLLRDGDRTVTEIATDLGFFHLGRFAEQYRQAFGEAPSVTRHRRRTARTAVS